MPYFIGQNARVGVAINGESSGMTFGGTPGSYDYMKLASGGGFKVEERCAKQVVEEIDVDARDIVTGGIYYTLTIDLVLSYSYREKLFQLFMGGALSTSGSGPYDHAIAKADKVLFGAIAFEYSDQAAQANEIIKEIYTNFAVTAISLGESPEGYVTMTVSGIATGRTRTTNEASLSTVQNSEPVSWSHLTATLNGTSTYHLGDLSVELSQSLTEGEFDHAASTPATLDFVGRAGQREVKYGFDIRMDSSAHTLLASQATQWTSANSFVWNNSGGGAAEREVSLVFGDSYQEGFPQTMAAYGRETASISMIALDGSTAILDVDIKNGRSSIAA